MTSSIGRPAHPAHHLHRLHRLALAAASAGLMALSAAPARAADAAEPVAVDASSQAAAQANRLFSVAMPEALKGVKRVAVPLFTVDFITADSEKAETSGFAAAGRATSISAYKLLGVGQTEFQGLTDAAYAGFLADLQAAGFEVVPMAAVQASATYRKILGAGKPAPAIRSDGMMLAPAGMGIWGASAAAVGGAKPGLFGGLAAMGGAFSMFSDATDRVELRKELDAVLIDVQLRVNFVQLTNENKGFLGRMSNTAVVSAKVFPSISLANYSVLTGVTGGAVTLKEPLALDAAAIADVRSKPTTAADVGAAVLTTLIKLASNSGASSSTEEKEVIADPARYGDIIGKGLSSANQMFVARLRAGQ